jgi:predicted TIM-barrel fold metal-dependent hydrolase
MAQFKVISTDSHVDFPVDEMKQRIPETYWDQIPQIRLSEAPESVEAVKSRSKQERIRANMNEDDLVRHARRERESESDVIRRIQDQDLDGVAGEVVFGPVLKDPYEHPEADTALARAYSDWAAEHFGAYPDRFAVSAPLTAVDIPAAVQEVYRLAKMGYRCVHLPARQPKLPYNRPDYDPLWAALEETGLVVNFHIASGRSSQGERGPGGPVINYILFAQEDGPYLVTYLCSSGVLERFPRLQWVTVESGGAWLGWILQVMDEIYKKHHMHNREQDTLKLLPSEYFKRQGHVTFMDDPIAVRNRDLTGPHSIMFGTDYPHHEGTFPHTQEVVERIFAGVPEEETAMIVGGTAAKLYRFSPQ